MSDQATNHSGERTGSPRRKVRPEFSDLGRSPVIIRPNRKGKPEIFARNLRLLTALHGSGAADACKEIGERAGLPINRKWYRRLCSKGISQLNGRNRQQLDAVVEFFNAMSSGKITLGLDDLWEEDLLQRVAAVSDTPVVDHRFNRCLRQLCELLNREDRRYGYLEQLIGSLYRERLRPSAG